MAWRAGGLLLPQPDRVNGSVGRVAASSSMSASRTR